MGSQNCRQNALDLVVKSWRQSAPQVHNFIEVSPLTYGRTWWWALMELPLDRISLTDLTCMNLTWDQRKIKFQVKWETLCIDCSGECVYCVRRGILCSMVCGNRGGGDGRLLGILGFIIYTIMKIIIILSFVGPKSLFTFCSMFQWVRLGIS